MSTDLAKLVVTLEAESARYQKELASARKSLSAFDKSAQASAVAIGTVMGHALAQVARATFNAGKAAVEYADKAGKAAQAAGMSVEFFSQLSYTAGLAEVGTEELSSATAKFTKNIGEALTGAKAQTEAFGALGVSLSDLQGLSPEQIFLKTAEGVSKMENASARNMAMQDLFGKSFAGLIPLMAEGRGGIEALNKEADKFGLTVTDKAAAAADQFGDTIDRMGAAARGASNQMVQELLPAMQEVADEMLRASKESGLFATAGKALNTVLQTVTVLGANVAFVFKAVGGEIGVIAAQAAALLSGDLKGAKFIGEEWTRDIAKARTELDAFQNRVLGLAPPLEAAGAAGKKAGAGGSAAGAGFAAGGSSAKRMKDAVGDLLRELEKQGATLNLNASALAAYNVATAGGTQAQTERARMIATANGLMEEQKAAMEAGKALTEQMRSPVEVLIDREAELGKLRAQGAITEATYTKAMADANKTFQETDVELVKIKEGFAAVDAIIAQTTSGKIEEATKQVEALAAAYEQGRFGAVGSAEAMAKHAEAVAVVVEGATGKVKEETDLMTEYAKNAAKEIQGSLADFLFDPFSSSTEEMGDKFAKMLQRMAAEAAAAEIMSAITGTGKGAGKDGGGWAAALGNIASAYLGSSSGAAKSDISTPAPVQTVDISGKARGGMVQPGQMSWVGERGPELAVAGTATKIIRNQDAMKMAGARGPTVQNFNITTPDANSFRASERQVTRQARLRLNNG